MFDKHGNDGHSIFVDASGRLKWMMEMDGFLRFHELPTARRDSVPELLKLLKLTDNNRGFLENYLAAPTYKAMAQTADGKSHATQYGAPSRWKSPASTCSNIARSSSKPPSPAGS